MSAPCSNSASPASSQTCFCAIKPSCTTETCRAECCTPQPKNCPYCLTEKNNTDCQNCSSKKQTANRSCEICDDVTSCTSVPSTSVPVHDVAVFCPNADSENPCCVYDKPEVPTIKELKGCVRIGSCHDIEEHQPTGMPLAPLPRRERLIFKSSVSHHSLPPPNPDFDELSASTCAKTCPNTGADIGTEVGTETDAAGADLCCVYSGADTNAVTGVASGAGTCTSVCQSGKEATCLCHFPPAYGQFGCTGNINGTCTQHNQLKMDYYTMMENLHEDLKPLCWLSGCWISKQGKGSYPDIMPRFNYHDELQFLCNGQPIYNFMSTSKHPQTKKPMHQERGFLRIKPGTNQLVLAVSHNWGISSIEEGTFDNKIIVLETTNLLQAQTNYPKVLKFKRRIELVAADVLEMTIEMQTENTPLTKYLTAVYAMVKTYEF